MSTQPLSRQVDQPGGTSPPERHGSAPGPTPTKSSRESDLGAGWGPDQEKGSWVDLLPEVQVQRLSWFNPKVLWASRNDFVARLYDPVPAMRARWVKGRNDSELTVDLSQQLSDFSFLLMGDTGEGDVSQYVLLPPLASHAPTAAFLMICSDVLYPVGDVNEYAQKFYHPYVSLPLPIYALPGNHDWYDGLTAFMYHFAGHPALDSGAEWTPPPAPGGGFRPGAVITTLRRRLAHRLWRQPARLDPVNTPVAMETRARHRPTKAQPGPYYVIDTAQLRLVCIDTGILGNLDAEQARWLLRVSADPRPKILLTGKPLVVDGKTAGCTMAGQLDGYPDVLAVVHNPEFNYVATIGGDVHNYQHYPVQVGGRVVHHVVSGGGGAFSHATHTIKKVKKAKAQGVTEEQFKCYPLRRDSMAAFSKSLQTVFDRWHIPFEIQLTPDEAGVYLRTFHKIDSLNNRPIQPVDDDHPDRVGFRVLVAGLFLYRLGGQKLLHKFFSPFLDWDDPPMHKHFLRIDVRANGATVTCFGVTGWKACEKNPPIEDRFELSWTPATQ